MKYEEAEKLKKSLRSTSYISKAGNTLNVYVVPENLESLKVYKDALRWNWDTLKDNVARRYTLKDEFILYGIRKAKNGRFAGGPFITEEHPEMI
jgi:hypothetical protein